MVLTPAGGVGRLSALLPPPPPLPPPPRRRAAPARAPADALMNWDRQRGAAGVPGRTVGCSALSSGCLSPLSGGQPVALSCPVTPVTGDIDAIGPSLNALSCAIRGIDAEPYLEIRDKKRKNRNGRSDIILVPTGMRREHRNRGYRCFQL